MNTNFGIWGLLPPFIAIVLALRTKQTIMSLFIAVWVGATMLAGGNPFIGFANIVSEFMIPAISDNASMLILITLSGGLVAMLRETGSAQAFAKAITHKINTPVKSQVTTALSAFLFSYTEPCLILGTIMRPVTDLVRVSRAKLAYILDSMGCNLASFSPISSYGPFIAGLIATQLTAAKINTSEWGIWLKMLPFNLYSLFAMVTVIFVAILSLDIGKMYVEEKRARETGKLLEDGVEPLIPEVNTVFPEGYEPTILNFILPMVGLFVSIFATIFWSGDIVANGVRGAFLNANIVLAICMGFLGGGIAAGLVGVVSKLYTPVEAFDHFTGGMRDLSFVAYILVCAWSIGGITSKMEVGLYLSGVVDQYLTAGLVPAMIFLFGAIIAFATGSSWGVWAIMMPIAIPMAITFNMSIPYVVGSVISGGMFGDQCSPISDTTIMSSTGASCNHVVHVTTQLPYGLSVGTGAFLGFLFGGLTGQYYLSILVAGVVNLGILSVLKVVSKRRYA